MSTYCETAPGDPVHTYYHDQEYGFPVEDDAVLFERLVLEINQAGLSWALMLKKREGFVAAYRGFDPAVVAAFGEEDRARLLADAGIIRNRLKVDAAIENAKCLLVIQESHGSFSAWITAHHPMEKDEWVKLFKKTFKFMGGEIVGEFLMSTGYLPGAHHEGCEAYQRLVKIDPPWMKAARGE